MQNEHTSVHYVRFAISIATLYLTTLGVGWYALNPPLSPGRTTYASTAMEAAESKPVPPVPSVISGQPVRIVIADAGIDLPIDEGVYDASDGSWTLSDNHPHYATMTSPANDHSGNTFIYGHGTDQVFGALAYTAPASGSNALIYTSNGHIFSYSFRDSVAMSPEDTSIFDYQGPPILTLQTCTGSVSEWRTMFHFAFEGIVQ